MEEDKIIFDLKWNYNYYLSRFFKGYYYITNNPEEAEKWKPTFKEIVEDMTLMLDELRKNGVEVTDRDVLLGFRMDPEKENAIF